jgi:hypothetical protein
MLQINTSGYNVTQNDKQPDPDARSLPASRAFVVQLQEVTTEDQNIFQGRIEHLASGKVEYFANDTELKSHISELLSREAL